MKLLFGEWAPDEALTNDPVRLLDALNVFPATGYGYLPMQALTAVSDALGEEATGGFVANNPEDGSFELFIGTTGHLYKYDSGDGSWDDVSNASGSYASTSTERWQFAQFGERVLATHVADEVQYYDLTSSALFADLPNLTDKARYIAVWGDYLVVGNFSDNQHRVRWSGTNDTEEWTAGTNNSGFQDFPDSGFVRGMTSSDSPFVLTAGSVRRGVAQPGSQLGAFAFNVLLENRGADAPYSIVAREDKVFFLSRDGFYMVSYAGELAAISNDRVFAFFTSDCGSSERQSVIGVIDDIHSRVHWFYRTEGASYYNRQLIYDWRANKWSRGVTAVQIALPVRTPGLVADDIDELVDDLDIPVDSETWGEGVSALAAINSDRKLAYFAGDNAEAVIITQEIGDTAGGVTFVNEVRPIVDATDATVAIGARAILGNAVAYTGEHGRSTADGACKIRSRAAFMRHRLTIPEGSTWTFAQGVDVRTQPAGRR